MAYKTDPYSNFRFKIKIDGKYVAAFSNISGFVHDNDPVKNSNNPEPVKIPGQTEYTPLSLERGVTYDNDFTQWANKVWDYKNTSNSSVTPLKDFRKNIVIDIYNEAGQVVLSYTVFNCWSSKIEALQNLDGNNETNLIQKMVLQNEGWKRDTSMKPSDEPDFTIPS